MANKAVFLHLAYTSLLQPFVLSRAAMGGMGFTVQSGCIALGFVLTAIQAVNQIDYYDPDKARQSQDTTCDLRLDEEEDGNYCDFTKHSLSACRIRVDADHETDPVVLTRECSICHFPLHMTLTCRDYCKSCQFCCNTKGCINQGTENYLRAYKACCYEPCGDYGKCLPNNNTGDYICDCKTGFHGRHCELCDPGRSGRLCRYWASHRNRHGSPKRIEVNIHIKESHHRCAPLDEARIKKLGGAVCHNGKPYIISCYDDTPGCEPKEEENMKLNEYQQDYCVQEIEDMWCNVTKWPHAPLCSDYDNVCSGKTTTTVDPYANPPPPAAPPADDEFDDDATEDEEGKPGDEGGTPGEEGGTPGDEGSMPADEGGPDEPAPSPANDDNATTPTDEGV